MQANGKTLLRVLSEPYVLKYDGGMINNEKTISEDHFRRISSRAEQKIDDAEQEAQRISEIFQRPTFLSVTSLNDETSKNEDILITSFPPHTILETGLTFHRDVKPGNQRFRWNLLFNLLLWLIVPFPCWIPFISNRWAFYLIPSIQALFVSMWTSMIKSSFDTYF